MILNTNLDERGETVASGDLLDNLKMFIIFDGKFMISNAKFIIFDGKFMIFNAKFIVLVTPA